MRLNSAHPHQEFGDQGALARMAARDAGAVVQDLLTVDVDERAGGRLAVLQLDPNLRGGQQGAGCSSVGQRHALARVDHRELSRVQPDDEQLPCDVGGVDRGGGHLPHAADVGGDADVDAGDPGPDQRDR